MLYSIFLLMTTMLTLQEPDFGVTILQVFNARASMSVGRFHIMSFLADAVVFMYPVFLVVVYIYSMIQRDRSMKEYALRIGMSSAFAF
jgi:hypothetical protein